jgi:CPA1 family monovalent cation:H+ antiporter
MVFVLNVLAFVLIGMQLGPIWHRLAQDDRLYYCEFAGAVLLTVILARIAWMAVYFTGMRLRLAADRPAPSVKVPTVKGATVVAWCGMRGIVTLAAAFALPEAPAFPYRDLILLTAFAVVLGSLLIQGLTLRPLIDALKFDADDPVMTEVVHARTIAFRAALRVINDDGSKEAKLLRVEYEAVLARAEDNPDSFRSGELPADPLRRQAIEAARRAILGLRETEVIGDDAFHLLEEELDWAELGAHAARVQ